MEKDLCQICKNVKYKYSCPKCNILYCSVKCYRDESHLICSEKFYKECIKEELINEASTSRTSNEVYKMLEILQRVSNNELIDENIFEEKNIDELDSDDEEEEENLVQRLEGININDSDELWNKLTKEEKFQFESLVQSGEIIKLVPPFDPWWAKQIVKKIITDINYNAEEDLKKLNYPSIDENILDFNKIMKNSPNPLLKFSLSNIIGAYTCTVRFFTGDHILNPLEAANYLWMISGVLKKNSIFHDDGEALKSIIIDGQNENLSMDIDDYSLIYNDVHKIFDGPFEGVPSEIYKLSALSDIRNIFLKAKCVKKNKKESKNTFSKKFANFNISDELKKDKMGQIIKKIDFFLSYTKNN